MKNVQIELTDEQVKMIAKLLTTRKDRSEKELLALIVERGMYALEYRTRYNKVRYARVKGEMEEFKEWRERKELVNALSKEGKIVAAPKQ